MMEITHATTADQVLSFLSDFPSHSESAKILALLPAPLRAQTILLCDVHLQTKYLLLLPPDVLPGTLEHMQVADRYYMCVCLCVCVSVT
jgi:hypothetical protein